MARQMVDAALLDRMRELYSRNWPINQLLRKYADTYERSLQILAAGDYGSYPPIWRALYRYASAAKGHEYAMALLQPYWAHIPPAAQLQLFEEHYSRTDRPDRLERIYREKIAEGALLRPAYRGLILLYCRSGRLEEAATLVADAAGKVGRSFDPLALQMAQNLGLWDLFSDTLERLGKGQKYDEEAIFRGRQILAWARSDKVPAIPFQHRFVNLDRETGRRAAIEARYRKIGVVPSFAEAYDGTLMSDADYASWCPTSRLHYGGVANLRSQMDVWQQFLRGTHTHMLVLEDDAWPIADLRTWEDLPALVERHAPDIVFVNERGCGKWWLRDLDEPGLRFGTALVDFDDTMRAPGLDGYLLSRVGARKLIDNFERDRAMTNIDWQVAAYSTTPAEWAQIPRGVQRATIGRLHEKFSDAAFLDAYCLNRPLIGQYAAGHATVHKTNLLINQMRGR